MTIAAQTLLSTLAMNGAQPIPLDAAWVELIGYGFADLITGTTRGTLLKITVDGRRALLERKARP